MNWLTKIGLGLFDLGLLPARFKIELDHNHQVRRSGFMDWWSYFDSIRPELHRYLKRKHVTYRIKAKDKPEICFWMERDYEVYKEAVEVKNFYTEQPRRMAEFLNEQNILFISHSLVDGRLSRFALFSPGEYAAVTLHCDLFVPNEGSVYYVPPKKEAE